MKGKDTLRGELEGGTRSPPRRPPQAPQAKITNLGGPTEEGERARPLPVKSSATSSAFSTHAKRQQGDAEAPAWPELVLPCSIFIAPPAKQPQGAPRRLAGKGSFGPTCARPALRGCPPVSLGCLVCPLPCRGKAVFLDAPFGEGRGLKNRTGACTLSILDDFSL